MQLPMSKRVMSLRKKIQKQIKENLPTQMIFNDISSLLTSPEACFYRYDGREARTLRYVVFNSSPIQMT